MSKFVLYPDTNIIAMLKSAGYSTYRLIKAKEQTGEYLLGQSTLTKLRHGKLPSWQELDRLIKLLHVSPVALIAWEADNGSVYDLNGKLIKPQTTNTNTNTRVSPYACSYEDPEYEDDTDPEFE